MKMSIGANKYEPVLHTLEPMSTAGTVIVVGGGVAGAYAAWHLTRLGFAVTVLSKDEGRLRTVKTLPQHGELNLGGMRFPESHRFVKTALRATGLTSQVEEFVNYNRNGRLCLRGHNVRFGDYLSLASVYDSHGVEPLRCFTEAMETVLAALNGRDGELAMETALRAGHIYGHQTLRQYLAAQGYNSEQIAYIGHINGVYPYVDTPVGELAIDYSSLYGSERYHRLKGGLVQLPEALLAQSGTRTVHAATVTRIGIGNDVHVEYHTPEGMRTLSADYLIMTAPAPAVAKIQWETALPAKQLEAFREVGYASSSKTLVECTEPFWLADDIDGGRDWTDLEIQQSVFPRGVQPGQPSVFTASYTWQDAARKMMAIADPDERFNLIAAQIERIHPGARKYLRRYEHIDWDAAAGGGAFAYYGPGDYERFHALLSAPFPECDPKVFLSGEGVGLHHGWAESALQSTQWAILQLLDIEA